MGVFDFLKKGQMPQGLTKPSDDSPLFSPLPDSQANASATVLPSQQSDPFPNAPTSAQNDSFASIPSTSLASSQNPFPSGSSAQALPAVDPSAADALPSQQSSSVPDVSAQSFSAPETLPSLDPLPQKDNPSVPDALSSQQSDPFPNAPTSASDIPDMIDHRQDDSSSVPSDSIQPASVGSEQVPADNSALPNADVAPAPAPEEFVAPAQELSAVPTSSSASIPDVSAQSSFDSDSSSYPVSSHGEEIDLAPVKRSVDSDVFVEKEAYRNVLFAVSDAADTISKSSDRLNRVIDDESIASAQLVEFKTVLDDVQEKLMFIDSRFFEKGDIRE